MLGTGGQPYQDSADQDSEAVYAADHEIVLTRSA